MFALPKREAWEDYISHTCVSDCVPLALTCSAVHFIHLLIADLRAVSMQEL